MRRCGTWAKHALAPWSQRTGAPEASATGRDKPAGTRWVHAGPAGRGMQRARAVTKGAKETAAQTASVAATRRHFRRRARVRVSPPGCREPFGSWPRSGWSPKTGLTLWLRWEPSLPGAERRRSCRPCHPRAISSGHQRYPADNHGHSEWTDGLGSTVLTCGGRGARNCMACKGSGVQIPSAPPQVRGRIRPQPSPDRPPQAADWQQPPSSRPIRRPPERHTGGAGWRRLMV
jgi:hypothetical protein